jgi:hypothetical protein
MIKKTDLQMLKSRIEKLEAVKKEIAVFKQKFEEELKPFLVDKNQLEDEIADLKLVISKDAIEEFEKTGVKRQLGGVGVQVKKTISYEQSKAFDYAMETKTCLSLDKKAFEKVASVLKPEFVTFGTENKATFPKEIKLEG